MKRRLRDLRHALRYDLGMSRLHPMVRVDLKAPIPVWTVRVTAALAALACLALSFPGALVWIVGFVAIGLILVARWAGAPALLTVLGGFSLVAGDPFEPRLHWLVLGLHIVFVLVGIGGDLPLRGVVERSVLLEPLPRFLVIQALAQGLILFGSVAIEQEIPAGWLAVGAALALAITAWVGAAAVARRTA